MWRIYGIEFICDCDVSWYPFDIQTCNLDFKSPGIKGTYIDLVRDSLKYVGKKEMSTYYLRDMKFDQKEEEKDELFNKGTYVQCIIILGRRLLSIVTTVYLPTILLNIIGHITHYFKPFFFESALAVNLTVMLVLTSMFIAVVEGLPKTSYMKMVEIWLIFNLLLPFVDVLLHTYTDHVRYCHSIVPELPFWSHYFYSSQVSIRRCSWNKPSWTGYKSSRKWKFKLW